MDAQQFEKIQEMIDRNNPLNGLKSVWVFILWAVAVIFGWANMNSSIETNARSIININEQIEKNQKEVLNEIEKWFAQRDINYGTYVQSNDTRLGLFANRFEEQDWDIKAWDEKVESYINQIKSDILSEINKIESEISELDKRILVIERK